MEQVNANRDNARAKLDEYRGFNAKNRSERQTMPDSFATTISNRLFIPRDFGPELDLPPTSLDEALRRAERDMRDRAIESAIATSPMDAGAMNAPGTEAEVSLST